MSHKNPKQIYRLIRTIKQFNPNSYILLSHDFASCSLDTLMFKHFSGIDFQFATGERGDFSLVEKYLSGINRLLSNNIDFDWLIALSAQDYPIQPLSEIENLLSKTKYDGFLEFFKVFSPESHWSMREGCQRYLYQYKKNPISLPKWIISILKITKIMNYLQNCFSINFDYGFRFGTKKKPIFDDCFHCYGGLFFTILSKECIEYLDDFSKTNTHIVEYYKNVILPEESFIQTVLVNSNRFNLYNQCKHYIDFYNSTHGHPAILTVKDYDAMTQKKYYFARKFDINVDSKILDMLDQKILKNLPTAYHNVPSTNSLSDVI
jgi:hypothetical protein